MKIGSLFSGYGGLDLAVEAVTGAHPAWFCEFDPAPSKALAYHWPDVPNHKDVTKIDWAEVEPVDILTGGSPCQDLSHAGKRAGMTEGTRSNLWVNMREAIATLRPKLVVWENVLGALSAAAESESDHAATSDMEPGGGLLAAPPGGHLRALGRVLGDLTEIGYDAEWTTLRASDIGAPHHRARVFLIAWPRTADPDGQPLWQHPGGTPAEETRAQSSHRPSDPRGERPTENRGNAPHPEGDGHAGQHDSSSSPKTRRSWVRDATGGAGSSDVPNPESWGRDHGQAQDERTAHRKVHPPDNHCDAAADPERDNGGQGAREHRGGEETEWSAAPSGPEHRGGALPDTENDGREWGGQTRGRGSGSAHSSNRNIEWGKYAPAIRRWERVLGVASPNPTEPNSKGNPRLAAPFAEWMMGLPPGWVTNPEIGLTRAQQLKAIGNGVCPQQAATALTHLLERRTQ